MSAEYSVEEAIQAADWISHMRTPFKGVLEVAARAYAERIEAGERAVLGTCPLHGVKYVGDCSGCAMTLPEKDFTHPPAQAAQVDCPTCGGVDLSDLGVECVRCTSASTHPHSPDAADSGRVSAVTADIVAAALHEFNRWNGAEDERSVAMDAALHLVWPQSNARDKARLSERKTVHLWLNDLHIEREECGRPLCLLRRLRILCDRYFDTCEQLSFEIRKHAAALTERGNG